MSEILEKLRVEFSLLERLVTGLVRVVLTGKPERNLGKLSFPPNRQ